MKSLLRMISAINRWLEAKLYVPDVSTPSGSLGAPMQKLDDTAVVRRLQAQRKPFIDAMINNLPLNEMSFCSVAAGYGAEEFLLKGRLKKMVLMEPSAYCFNFLCRTYGEDATLNPDLMERAQFDSQFDFIYTSSPTNWMQLHPSKGIPESFKKFLDENLKTDGIFYLRAYGGLHEDRVVKSNYFYNQLIKTLSPQFVVHSAYYNRENVQARIIITRSDFKETDHFRKFVDELSKAEGRLKVSKNRLVEEQSTSLGQILMRSLALLIYLPLRFARQIAKSILGLWTDICTNLKL